MLLLPCLLLLTSPEAGAGVTIDLLWRDTGTPTLRFLDPRGDAGPGSGCGFRNGVPEGRCLFVTWTTTTSLFVGSNTVAWDPQGGLRADFASFFAAFNGIPVGKNAVFRKSPAAVPIDAARGRAGSFTGRSGQPPPNGQDALPPGSYRIGTLVFDVSSAGDQEIAAIVVAGLDAFRDVDGAPVDEIVLHPARLVRIVPEPATAALLLGAVVGLAAFRRAARR